MRVAESSVAGFKEFVKNKNVVCFGSGDYFKLFVFDFGDVANITAVIDNDPKKHGTSVSIGNINAKISPVSEAQKMLSSPETVFVITASAYREIVAQLQVITDFDDVTCYIYAQIKYSGLKPTDTLPQTCDLAVIPPVIHYCWFGKKTMPENLKRCVDSWKRFCPGYEIIEWNEKNYDYSKSKWTKTAFEKKQWSYLADYARIDIIVKYGGFYFDTDVEFLRNLDPLRFNQGFAATEFHAGINFGSGIGGVKGLEVFQEILTEFERKCMYGVTFCRNVGRETEIFWRHGYRLNGEFQLVDGVAVLPFNIFTPLIADTGEQFVNDATVGIHYFNRGWR